MISLKNIRCLTCSIRVNLLTLYGTCTLPFLCSSPRAEITLPSASNPLLFFIPAIFTIFLEQTIDHSAVARASGDMSLDEVSSLPELKNNKFE